MTTTPDPALAERLRKLREKICTREHCRRLYSVCRGIPDEECEWMKDLAAAAKIVEDQTWLDVTAGITQALEMLIGSDVYRGAEVDPALLSDLTALLRCSQLVRRNEKRDRASRRSPGGADYMPKDRTQR